MIKYIFPPHDTPFTRTVTGGRVEPFQIPVALGDPSHIKENPRRSVRPVFLLLFHFKYVNLRTSRDVLPMLLKPHFFFRKINMEHSFITQLKNQRRNLYVIHEAVHASEETTFKDSNRLEGSIIAQIYVKLHVKVQLFFQFYLLFSKHLCAIINLLSSLSWTRGPGTAKET